MQNQVDPIDRAIKDIGWRRRIEHGSRYIVVACLVREKDWRPLKADWWRGKEACVIGADLDGNFFLRHCDGKVRLWDHKSRADLVIARSVQEFVSKIVE